MAFDLSSILANGVITSLISGALALVVWKLGQNRIRNAISAEIGLLIQSKLAYYQANPAELDKVIAPILALGGQISAEGGAGEAQISLGPFNKYVPKFLRPMVAQKAYEYLSNMQIGKKEIKQIAETVNGGLK